MCAGFGMHWILRKEVVSDDAKLMPRHRRGNGPLVAPPVSPPLTGHCRFVGGRLLSTLGSRIHSATTGVQVTTTPSPWRLGVELVRLPLVCGNPGLLLHGTAPVVRSARRLGCGGGAVGAAAARLSTGTASATAPDGPDDD